MGGTLYYNDGTKLTITFYNNRLLPTRVTNRNGDYIQMSYVYAGPSPYALSTVTDTQGRVLNFNYDGSGSLISITAPGYGGTAQNPVTRTVAQFDYQTRTVSYTFSGLTVENAPTGPVKTLRHIYFPATGSGRLYSYSDYGMIYNVSARRQMTIDGNGVISDGVEVANIAFNYPTSGTTVLTDAPTFTQRTESTIGAPSGTYSYSSSVDSVAQTTTFTVARPDASTLVLTRSTNASSAANGLLVQFEIRNSLGSSMTRSVYAYVNGADGSRQLQSTIAYDDAGTPAKADFDCDQYGNVVNKRDYGYQISGAWQVRRRTNYIYTPDSNYTSRYLRSLVTEVKVSDALQNTNDADDILIAKSTFILDDYAATGGMESYSGMQKVGHDGSYGTSFTWRGNVTGTTQWTDIGANTTLPTRLRKYDVFGNVLQEQLSCCKQKVFTYVQDDYWANPTTMTDGDPQGQHVTGSTAYDFNTGLPKLTEFANLGKRRFYYDAALRLTRHELPTAAVETASYDDAAMIESFTVTGRGTNTVTHDGFGRMTQTVDQNNAQVNIGFDGMGRVASQTNPFTAGGTAGPATTVQYDALGRNTITTFADGNTTQNVYAGGSVTAIDQVDRKIKRDTDGLGRLVKVTEQASSGALTQETSYSYNVLDELTLVNQGAQTRAFKYDALGRMLYERIPEQTATINDGTGTYWSMKYTYTDFSAVATQKDARGVTATYSYDQMNRRTSVSYGGAPGVASTGAVNYNYDNDNYSPTNGLVLSITAGGYSESYAYDTYKRPSSITRTIDSVNYTTGYRYGAGDLRSQITYPTGRVLNINRDSVGKLSSLTDGAGPHYLSGVGYDAAGHVTGLTLGNGVAETYGYDANRMQLITQTATKSGGPQNGLMNLTYSYQASAGQMGTGSTTGNAGQSMSISGTINGTTESASYTYDLVGRLVTSSQTSNGASAQRRFVYDRWGNRTSVYDAVSGGIQIQYVNLEQSGGAPTNRISSVAAGLSLQNYTYDAAGNVTNDGVHTYQYDAENRLVNVDGGSTGQYSYDQNNRRYKKTAGGSVTHYVWEGSQVVSEHNSAGAVSAEYIYSWGGMIAKIAGGATQYFLGDRLSGRVTLDSSGNVVGRQAHLPFGEDFAESGGQEKHHFTSYDRGEETGLDYAINRWYSPAVGRFTSADPYRPSAHLMDPRSWNRYSYTRNVLTNRVDPLGLEDDEPIRIGVTVCFVGGSLGGGGMCGGDILGGLFGGRGIIRPNPDGKNPGPAGQVIRNLTPKDSAKAFLKDKSRCEKKINEPAGKKEGLGTIEQALDRIKFIDAGDLPDSELGKSLRELGFPSWLSESELASKLGEHVGPFPARQWKATGLTNPANHTMYLSGVWYTDHSIKPVDSVIVHEALHDLFQTDHKGIAEALGLSTEGDEKAISKRIDDWLNGGCKK